MGRFYRLFLVEILFVILGGDFIGNFCGVFKLLFLVGFGDFIFCGVFSWHFWRFFVWLKNVLFILSHKKSPKMPTKYTTKNKIAKTHQK